VRGTTRGRSSYVCVASRMADSWSEKLAQSWLAYPEACAEMDAKLAQQVAVHWDRRGAGATAELLLPTRCETTAASLAELGPQPDAAMSCTLLLVVLGELLLCAEHGGILRDDVRVVERFADGDQDRRQAAEALRLLRNAACHPAAVASSAKGEVGIVSFANFLIANFKEATWAKGLRTQPVFLAHRRVSLFALRMVESIGVWRADHWGVRHARLELRGTPHASS
jgi:hypothetical protein